MPRYLSIILFSLLIFGNITPASAQIRYHGRKDFKPFLTTEKNTEFNLSTGLRFNDFDWNIASDAAGVTTPNILSELSWEGVTVFELEGRVRHEIPADIGPINGGILVGAVLTGGFTVAGDNQDSDYNGNDRTLEFSRSNNDASQGYALGADASIGYKFNFAQRRYRKPTTYLSLTPLAGYAWDQQQYKMTDGFQTIPATGAFAGLDSEYTADWFGPYAGLEAQFGSGRHMTRLRGEYHLLDYDAEATWNLRDDFQQDPSFIQTGDGDGFKISGEYAYALDSYYSVTLDAFYEQRSLSDGTDTLYFSDGTVVDTLLNEVNDRSYAGRIGLRKIW